MWFLDEVSKKCSVFEYKWFRVESGIDTWRLFLQFVPRDGDGGIRSFGKKCILLLKMKQNPVIETHPVWHLDPSRFCSRSFTLCWFGQWTKGSGSKTTRWKTISSVKAENCLNKCGMQQGNSAQTGQNSSKHRSVHYMLRGG